jgi:hypothetical protein
MLHPTEGALDRLRTIEVTKARLRSALTVWAEDGLLVARLDELEREEEQLRDEVGLASETAGSYA